MNNKKIIIAIDGYSSTGKSTFAKVIARQLGYIYVDTGAMYRTVTLYAMRNGLISADGVINNDKLIEALPKINIEFRFNTAKGNSDTYLNGECVESAIRSIEVSQKVSPISAIPQVREQMVRQQQIMGSNKGLVMDGRDIGTVVFPQAEIKLFMTADVKVRAKRRYDELKAKGDKVTLHEIEENIAQRDYTDTHRAVSPLVKANDAIVLDNSNMTPEQQLDWFNGVLKNYFKKKHVEVEIDEKSGFCYGVIRAIETTESELKHDESLYSLGEIVHNTVEVNRLEEKGLKTISHDNIGEIKGRKMVIRAHGEPPSTYKIAEENNIKVIDCTCPVVLKLQERIKRSYEKLKSINGQLIIFGKRGHAEVNGLIGQVGGDAIVIEKLDEIGRIDFTRPVCLFSQTTKSLEDFETLRSAILYNMQQALGKEDVPFESHNTTCKQVTNRQPHLEEFSRKHDVIIFVSGKQSSNGKVLYQACKSVNEHTYFVECSADLKKEWFTNCQSVGVCGATSTPKWLMEDVANEVKKITIGV